MTITAYAGANHIFPDVFTTSISWDDMVQGKLANFLTTILADVVVTVENLKASQLPLVPGTLNYISQADY
jgi:hypothetical protein